MSSSGLWVVVALGEEDVAGLAPAFRAVLSGHTADPEVRARWERWASAPEQVREYRPERPGSLHLTLDGPSQSFTLLGGWPLADAGELVNECRNRHVREVTPFVAVTRRVDPALVLFYGLGPERAQALPGWCGNFILTPAECRTALPEVERALELSGPDRSRVVRRMRTWLTEVGDDPDCDPEEMIMELRDCWRAAAERGLGLCGTTETV